MRKFLVTDTHHLSLPPSTKTRERNKEKLQRRYINRPLHFVAFVLTVGPSSSRRQKASSSTDIKEGSAPPKEGSSYERLRHLIGFFIAQPRIFARGAKTGGVRRRRRRRGRERFLFATPCLPLHRDFPSPPPRPPL